MSNEEDAREAADTSLTTRVSNEEDARVTAVAALQADVDQNEADSDAAESSLKLAFLTKKTLKMPLTLP